MIEWRLGHFHFPLSLFVGYFIKLCCWQITGDLNVASNALLQVTMRLKANIFEMEGALPALPPALPYPPASVDMSDSSRFGNRDNKSRGRGYSTYSDGYGSTDLPPSGSYGASQVITAVHLLCFIYLFLSAIIVG